MGATDAEIRSFLAAYGEALSRGDGGAVADMWELPALVLSDEGALAVSERAQVVEFFDTAAEEYRERGLVGTAAEAVAIEQLSDHLCSVNVRWVGVDEHGTPAPERELSSYVLRRDDSGTVRIQVAMALPSRIPG